MNNMIIDNEKLSAAIAEYTSLFSELQEKMFEDGYYNWPETDQDNFYYSLPQDFQPTLEAFCNAISYDEDYWTAPTLYDFLSPFLARQKNYFDCGGVTPVLAAAVFVKYFGHIDSLLVDFTHDKWEHRGEYCLPSRVGITYDALGNIVFITTKYTPFDDDADPDEDPFAWAPNDEPDPANADYTQPEDYTRDPDEIAREKAQKEAEHLTSSLDDEKFL